MCNVYICCFYCWPFFVVVYFKCDESTNTLLERTTLCIAASIPIRIHFMHAYTPDNSCNVCVCVYRCRHWRACVCEYCICFSNIYTHTQTHTRAHTNEKKTTQQRPHIHKTSLIVVSNKHTKAIFFCLLHSFECAMNEVVDLFSLVLLLVKINKQHIKLQLVAPKFERTKINTSNFVREFEIYFKHSTHRNVKSVWSLWIFFSLQKRINW